MELPGFTNVTETLQAGVYALVFKGVVVYIGKSKCMLTRVYAHRSLHKRSPGSDVPKWLKIKGVQFDELHVWPCKLSDVDRIEQEMIGLYKPKFNVFHVGHKCTMEIPLRINGVEIVLNRAQPRPQTEPFERRI